MAYRYRPGVQPVTPAQPSLGRGLDGAGTQRVNRVNPDFSELRHDGPTLEEWVKAGYLPEHYPPRGWAEKPSAGLTAYRAQQQAGAAVVSSPLTEGTTDVRTDELSRSEETGRGIPGGGGSADDHPSGGSASGSEAADGGATDPAQAGDGAGADGASPDAWGEVDHDRQNEYDT